MTKSPRISGRELIRALEKADFSVIRIKGSHHFLQHVDDSRCTVVPVHRGEIIGQGLLAKILKDVELTTKDLSFLLRK